MHARVVVGVGNGALFREVSSVQECPHRERGSTAVQWVCVPVISDLCLACAIDILHVGHGRETFPLHCAFLLHTQSLRIETPSAYVQYIHTHVHRSLRIS